jgi:predicted ABC-class ATPase
VDEDTCATNFMIRDAKMMKLVAPNKEPITPFVQKVRALYQERGISSIIVVGASGDFFDVADLVIMMDGYRCEDVTEEAKRIAENFPSLCSGKHFGAIRPRFPVGRLFESRERTKVTSTRTFTYGDDEVDLSGLEQIVCTAQTNAIVLAIQKFASFRGTHTLPESIAQLDAFLDREGMDELSPFHYHGGLARPRQLKIAGAINRLRIEGYISQADPLTEPSCIKIR